jgi:hypothetical protein
MANTPVLTKYQDIPCCPDLLTGPICDILDFRRRLVFPTTVRGTNEQQVKVEVIFHTRFTRCSGPLALGEIAYTTTLLPGEKVRLATTDRRSRFSFDSESKLSYRSEQISEEQYRMRAMRALMSDENVTDRGNDHYSDQGKWDFHGDASGSIGFFSASADTNAKGSHSGSSARDYMREHKAHAEMSDNQSVEATRKAHSVSVGSVDSRTHSQGESEDHFESSSREFSNPNHCHAITFFFYRINKTETVKFEIVRIERRVLDPVAPVPIPVNPFAPVGGVATLPQEVPATGTQRVEILSRSIQAQQLVQAAGSGGVGNVVGLRTAIFSPAFATAVAELGTQQPIPDAIRQKALAEVDAQLATAKLIDPKTGLVSKDALDEFGYERTTSIPTAGIVVKGCFDDCDICEPEVQKKLELELVRMDLENKLLARQIELLDKSQEYRCCPVEEEEKV